MIDGKICTKCAEYKSLDKYYKAKKGPKGVKCACKQCLKPIQHQHYLNNKEKYKRAFQEFMLRNPTYQQNNKEKYKRAFQEFMLRNPNYQQNHN